MNTQKRLLLICLFLIGNILCFSQQNNTTIYQNKETSYLNISLKGKVRYFKKVYENLATEDTTEIEYFFDKKGLTEKVIKKSLGFDVINRKYRDELTIFEFNEGKLISALNQFDSIIDGFKYELDNKENVIQKKYYIQNRVVSEESYEYDNLNRLVKTILYIYGYFYNETVPDKSKYPPTIKTFEFDDSGNIIAETTDRLKDKFFEKKIFKFDTNGNILEEGRCEDYSGLSSECKCIYSPLYGWKYNEKNQLIKKFQLAKFSPHNTDTYYEYDKNGNETDIKGYYINNDTLLGYQYSYEYDKLGNQIEEEEVVGNYRSIGFERFKTVKKKFDEFSNIVLEEYINKDGSRIKVIRNNYVYDKLGNWIKHEREEGKTKEDLIMIEKQYRTIKYY